jgi:hypothetical protein
MVSTHSMVAVDGSVGEGEASESLHRSMDETPVRKRRVSINAMTALVRWNASILVSLLCSTLFNALFIVQCFVHCAMLCSLCNALFIVQCFVHCAMLCSLCNAFFFFLLVVGSCPYN